ncbi:MAG TPA: pseudouridine synthase [Tenuifilaceae bacterium]|nr:pseudouridine synthase [Tenuifilaceae bacterium]
MEKSSFNRDVKREKRTNSQEEPTRVYRPRTLTSRKATPETENENSTPSSEGEPKKFRDDYDNSGQHSEQQNEEPTQQRRKLKPIAAPAGDFPSRPHRPRYDDHVGGEQPNRYTPRSGKYSETDPSTRFSRKPYEDSRPDVHKPFRSSDPYHDDKPKHFEGNRHEFSDGHFSHPKNFRTNSRNFSSDRRERQGSSYNRDFDSNPAQSYRSRTFQGSYGDERKHIERKNLNTFRERSPQKDNSGEISTNPTGPIRLNRYIAISGLCSRREADVYIQNGQVTVNGKVVTELGTKVNLTDEICFKGKVLKSERMVYILLNKPKDYITTMDDPHAKRTVMELIEGACPQRVYPVGRLDRNSTGVLLLTNDGELTAQLTHPSFKKKKVYQVGLDRKFNPNDFQKLTEGIEIDGEVVKVDAVDYVEGGDGTELGVEIHSGQNRVVRRMFDALGYGVVKLDRVYFAGLTKKNLPRGKWRFLTPKEVNMLKMGRF